MGARELLEQSRDRERARKANRTWAGGAGGRSGLPHLMVGLRQDGTKQPQYEVEQEPAAGPSIMGAFQRIAIPSQTWNGALTLGDVVYQVGWNTAKDVFARQGYINFYLDVPVTTPAEVTWQLKVDGATVLSDTAWAAGRLSGTIPLDEVDAGQTWELHADGLDIGAGTLTVHVVDRAASEATFTPQSANILLAAADLTQQSVQDVVTTLEALGHTVSTVDTDSFDGTASDPDAADYDLVFCNRPSADTDFRAWLIAAVAAGTPACIDPAVPSSGGDIMAGSLPTQLDLAGDIRNSGYSTGDTHRSIILENVAHPVTSGLGSVDDEVFVYDNESGQMILVTGEPYVGTLLATAPPGSGYEGQVNSVAVEAGTALLTSGTLGARVVWSTVFYAAVTGASPSGADYTADGRQFVQNAVQWAIGAL